MTEVTEAMTKWYQAARAAGWDYRRATSDPRIRELAQAGPMIVVGLSCRVAGEDGHVSAGTTDTPFSTIVYRHPEAVNDN